MKSIIRYPAIQIVILLCAASCFGQTSTNPYPHQAPPTSTRQAPTQQSDLTNTGVIQMSRLGLDDDIIIARIKHATLHFQLGDSDLLDLKQAGVSSKVVAAMLDAAATTLVNVSNTPTSHSIPAKSTQQMSAASTCVILKRMGPADQITSHLYAFGLRGKQFQYVEGDLPKGVTFHGRLTDHDVRIIQDHGGKLQMLEPKYTVADLEEARNGCQTP
jgi:hypothetical protein